MSATQWYFKGVKEMRNDDICTIICWSLYYMTLDTFIAGFIYLLVLFFFLH